MFVTCVTKKLTCGDVQFFRDNQKRRIRFVKSEIADAAPFAFPFKAVSSSRVSTGNVNEWCKFPDSTGFWVQGF